MLNNIVVIGGVNADIKGKSYNQLVMEDSNPGFIKVSPGGVGRNIAHNLALMNIPVSLLSVIGDDHQGSGVLSETRRVGVNTDEIMICNDEATGTYMALLDKNGEMKVALSSMDIYNKLDCQYLDSKKHIIQAAKYVICDANIPEASLSHCINLCSSKGIPVVIEPVSAAKAAKLINKLKGTFLITPNKDELHILTGFDKTRTIEEMASFLVSQGVENVITTMGKQGICHTNKEGSRFYESYETTVTDVTGAGDSLTAGVMYGLYQYGTFEAACAYGLAAAAITVSSKDTVSCHMTETALKNRVAIQNKN